MGFIIYSIIVQFGWKSRECSSAVGTKLAPHRYTPMCLYALLREHSLTFFPTVLTTEILFDFAVNGFGSESEFLVEHFERCAVAEVVESENSSGISGQSFEDNR